MNIKSFLAYWKRHGIRAAAALSAVLFCFELLALGVETRHPPLQRFLLEAKSEKGIEEFRKRVLEKPTDATELASLGVLQFVNAIEGLAQEAFQYGLLSNRNFALAGIRLPVPENDQSKELSYELARGILQDFLNKLVAADSTLSKFEPDGLKIVIEISEIFVDINGDGKTSEGEAIASMLGNVMGFPNATPAPAGSLVFTFDDADVYWLRGYINVLAGITEAMLAHDWKDAFERIGHLVFTSVKSPYKFLQEEGEHTSIWNENSVIDFIAAIHLVNFEVVEPERMSASLEHIERVVELSRTTWKLIRQETDDDREWLPNREQHSAMLGGQVGGDLGDDWEHVLDQFEAILKGKWLLPFWRGFPNGNAFMVFGEGSGSEINVHPTLGINLRKMFTDPTRFDAVLWLQGTGVQPFLETGDIIDLDAWESLDSTFNGRLPFFAFWIN